MNFRRKRESFTRTIPDESATVERSTVSLIVDKCQLNHHSKRYKGCKDYFNLRVLKEVKRDRELTRLTRNVYSTQANSREIPHART